MVLQLTFVPFKRKLHNLFEYFILFVTLATLFIGLFFFVDLWTDTLSRDIVTWITFMLIIISLIISVLVILWDWRTRFIKNRIKINLKREKMKKQYEYEEKAIKVLEDLHEILPVDTKKMPWDDYKFSLYNNNSDDELSDDKFEDMNSILSDLFNVRRVAKVQKNDDKKKKKKKSKN
jgi:hypothetical protein